MKLVNFSLLPLLAFACLSAFAGDKVPGSRRGPGDGGGGQGVVCRNADRSIRSVELLDIWEAREVYGRKIESSEESVESQVETLIERLKNFGTIPWQYGASQVEPEAKHAEALKLFLRNEASKFINKNGNVNRLYGKRLTKTEDSYEEVVPDDESCTIEQLVNYKDIWSVSVKNILVNQGLVDLMDNTNKAALFVHEGLYAALRTFGEKNSLRTRRAIGYAVSGGTYEPLANIISNPHIICENNYDGISGAATRVYFTRYAKNLVAFVPTKLNGMIVSGFSAYLGGGSPTTITRFFSKELNGSGMGSGGGLTSSPSDFDLQVHYRTLGKHQIEVKILNSASGVTTPVPVKLNCRLVKKPYEDTTF